MKPWSELASRSAVAVDPVKGIQVEVASIVRRTRSTQLSWASTPLAERLKVVSRFRSLLVDNAESIVALSRGSSPRSMTEILSSEVVPLADACLFLERNARAILKPTSAGWWKQPLWLFGVQSRILREPFGLVLIIAPGNYPLLLPGVQVVQALVAGNAVLLKPGQGGTASAYELLKLLSLAGLPPGVLELLPEAAEAAQAAIAARPDKVLFTGSARTGVSVLTQLAPLAVPSTMELSGCDAVFVRADADLDLCVSALQFGLRLNSGRTCIAPRRVFVPRSLATEFEGRLSEQLASTSPPPQYVASPLRLVRAIGDALADGAHIIVGEVRPNGSIRAPLVIGGVPLHSPLLVEDFFAPVMSVVTVADDQEALDISGRCPYALGATIFGRDVMAAEGFAQRLNCGVVVINDMIVPTADPRLPFGGRKQSGFGVTRGREGLLEMTATKVLAIRHGRFRPHYENPRQSDAYLHLALLKLTHSNGFGARLKAFRDLLRALAQRRAQAVKKPTNT
jgi:acyl-CoA reductase-like NAD-dependent aldehyde dehydrogenase